MNAIKVLPQTLWRRWRARRWPAQVALAWLVLALAVVPALGRLHQVAHAGALEQVHAGHGQQALASADDTGRADDDGLPQLAGHHSPADCLLLDQLALGDALHADVPALPLALAAAVPPPIRAVQQRAVHIALFHARGPPVA